MKHLLTAAAMAAALLVAPAPEAAMPTDLVCDILPLLCEPEPSATPRPPRDDDDDDSSPRPRAQKPDRPRAGPAPAAPRQVPGEAPAPKKKAKKAQDRVTVILWCLPQPLSGWVVQIVHRALCGSQAAVYGPFQVAYDRPVAPVLVVGAE